MNRDQKTRDMIIFRRTDVKYPGGCEYFEGMSLEKLKKLVELDFTGKTETQNYSPSIGEMIEFAEEHKGTYITFDGYAVTEKRQDYRVTINAINIEYESLEDMIDAVNFTRLADEFSMTTDQRIFGWWD